MTRPLRGQYLNEASLFCRLDEYIGRDHIAGWTVPADKRFRSYPLSGLQIHNGLVVQYEFLALESDLKHRKQSQLLARQLHHCESQHGTRYHPEGNENQSCLIKALTDSGL